MLKVKLPRWQGSCQIMIRVPDIHDIPLGTPFVTPFEIRNAHGDWVAMLTLVVDHEGQCFVETITETDDLDDRQANVYAMLEAKEQVETLRKILLSILS